MLDEIGKFLESDVSSKKAGKLEIGLRNIIARTAKLLKKDEKKKDTRSRYLNRKISDIRESEIITRVESFKACLDRFQDVECINIGHNLFVIRN